MFRFKTGNIVFSFDFSFLLFNGLIFTFRDLSLIASFYAVCFIHETGHILAVNLTKGNIRSVDFSGMGIKITTSPPTTSGSGIFILLSGPLLNIAVFALMYFSGKNSLFSMLNLWEGIINLLPLPFLDGGAVIKILRN